MEDKIRAELQRAVGETYSAIASDVDGPPGEIDWAEMVMDANRIEMFGDLSDEALAELKKMSWKEMTDFANSCNYW